MTSIEGVTLRPKRRDFLKMAAGAGALALFAARRGNNRLVSRSVPAMASSADVTGRLRCGCRRARD